MGEFISLIYAVKNDKNEFCLIVDKMEPLIKKYVRLLYKDDKEDVRSELLLALWEAVSNITYYENDGQVVRYLSISLRNRYLELYKSSRKLHDYESVIEDDEKILEKIVCCKNEYDDVIFNEDVIKIINTYTGIKRKIVYFIVIDNLSDAEIAEQLKISRQYVNRIRRTLRKQFSLQDERGIGVWKTNC